MNNIYLYFHINPVKNEIFYVGLGRKRRAWSKARNIFWKNTVNKYGGFIVDIVEENLSIEEACERERFYIKKIGRRDLGLGSLVNMTDGGEYMTENVLEILRNKKRSKESINRYILANKGKNKGRKLTEEHKIKIGLASKGRKHTQETINKMKGRVCSDDTLAKMIIASQGRNKGRITSKETKLKLSLVNKGRRRSKEFGLKMSLINKGKKRKPLSEEQKIKLSIINKGRIQSQETKDKRSKTLMGHKVSEETKLKLRSVKLGKPRTNKGPIVQGVGPTPQPGSN